jgi:truncated hemoglobin YjbI
MISSAEIKPSGPPPTPFIEESWPMKVSATFSRVPIYRTWRRDKACLSPWSLEDAWHIKADITAAHAHAREQGLNDAHFDAFLKHFRAALKEVGVKAEKADKVMELLESRRGAVLNR